MKKLKYLLLFILLIPTFVCALSGDKINRIDVTITLDEYGNAHIVEVWDAYAGSGTEFYKAEYNLGNMEISNFKVIDETGVTYTFVDDWDIDKSLSEKAYKNGYYYSTDGLELCFGKTSYGLHKYTLSYDVSNFVFNTNDSQIAYWSVINQMEDMPDDFTLTLSGPSTFADTLDVWGYGYKGYAYVNSGKVMMSNEEETNLKNGDYAVLLIKFPLNTFKIDPSNVYSQYEEFDDVLNQAEEGTFEYDYDNETFFQKIMKIISSFIVPIMFFMLAYFIAKSAEKYKFGEKGRNIKMSEINMFREIPCNKDIFRAFFVAQVYRLNSKNTDFFGSVFLKWLFDKKIELKKEIKKNVLGKEKEETSIILKDNITLDTSIETELYNYLLKASKDGILEKDELSKWSKNNYNKLFKWFEKAEEFGRDIYVNENLVSKINSNKYLITDNMKDEAIKLAGLKKYLIEFSRIKEKEAIEVMLWKEYLMYAQIFGIADKVAEQFEKLYPEIVNEVTNDIDLNDIVIINNLSNTAVASASSARSAAQSYSSGGGGFSSGGGGGGSFGGGGGGGR